MLALHFGQYTPRREPLKGRVACCGLPVLEPAAPCQNLAGFARNRAFGGRLEPHVTCEIDYMSRIKFGILGCFGCVGAEAKKLSTIRAFVFEIRSGSP